MTFTAVLLVECTLLFRGACGGEYCILMALHLQIARLEVAIDQSCQRWVCLYHGIRLEAGDTWLDNNNTCYCSQVGTLLPVHGT